MVDADGKVVGVVSEGDMLPKEALLAIPGSRVPSGEPRPNDFAKVNGVTAASIMTRAPITVTPDEPVTSAARLMYSCKVKSLPVVTGTGHLAGIISRADVLSVYRRPGAEIEREIVQDVIRAEFHGDPGRFTVTVKDGIVTLQGHPDTAQQARDILAQSGTSRGSYRCGTASPIRREAHPMSYPNTVLSVWQMTIMAVVPVLALFGWLIAIFIAARPRQRDAATTLAGATGSRAGSASARPRGRDPG